MLSPSDTRFAAYRGGIRVGIGTTAEAAIEAGLRDGQSDLTVWQGGRLVAIYCVNEGLVAVYSPASINTTVHGPDHDAEI